MDLLLTRHGEKKSAKRGKYSLEGNEKERAISLEFVTDYYIAERRVCRICMQCNQNESE